ncbi:hypothetical protein R3W88_000414 [Solanum pinnatisectum]|uniref:Lipid desaturase domain-containing protein n=1 Tax=Solanum pinnatisectum TaxID=50273 RepID=A0AAV9MFA8_9SOLN|nr:hypothetical protein R3W88_000414 [Solanum pinnatisectum]
MSSILPHNHDIRSSQQVLSRTSDEIETIQHRDKRVQEVYSITNPGGNSTRSVISDPTLQSSWTHRVWMISGCTTLLICLVKSTLGAPVARAMYYRLPHNNNYCIVSGLWNNFLDGYKIFELLERIFFFIFGPRPRSWSGLDSEWTEEIETQSLRASQY